MDWEELYREVLRLIATLEASFEESVQEFVERLLAELRARGYELPPELEREIEAFVTDLEEGLRRGIEEAIALAATQTEMRPAFIQDLLRRAWEHRWPDGLRLSDRLWRWREETLRAVSESLKEFVELGRSAQTAIFDLQRAIDRAEGGRHQIVSDELPKFLRKLREAARRAIHTPKGRRAFEKALQKVRRYASQLADVGMRRPTLHMLDQISRAVREGNEALLEEAIRWRMYDKQLYNLKRITRTEMANAFHRSQIEATRDDPQVLGYKWKLAPDHPKPDICDWYATIDFGLGKGVWPKDRVPPTKAHPHCLCLLVPTVLPGRERGHVTPGEFLDQISPGQRRQIAPRWAQRLNAFGIPWERLIDPESGWFLRRQDLVERIGEERLRAMEALGRATEERDWGSVRLRGRPRRHLLELCRAHPDDPVARRVRQALERGEPISSLESHYLKRRYLDRIDLRDPEDLNRRFDQVLQAENAQVYRQVLGEEIRWIVHDRESGWIVIVHQDGRRVTSFPLEEEPSESWEPQWTLQGLRTLL